MTLVLAHIMVYICVAPFEILLFDVDAYSKDKRLMRNSEINIICHKILTML